MYALQFLHQFLGYSSSGIDAPPDEGSPFDAPPAPVVSAGPSDARLDLGDGTTVGYVRTGAACGLPIVYQHGFLGSRLEATALGTPLADTIALDRPGYGHTTGIGDGFAAWGAASARTLDRLGVDRCVVIGVSGGAPYALATALALRSRCAKLVLVGGVAGPDLVRASGWPMRLMPFLADRPKLGLLFTSWTLGRLRYPIIRRRGLRAALAEERRVLDKPTRARLVEGLADSFAAGSDRSYAGVQHDITRLTHPWDVAPEDFAGEALVLHGTADTVVPYAHAEWWAGRLRGARLVPLEGEHHVSAVVRVAAYLPDLARGTLRVR